MALIKSRPVIGGPQLVNRRLFVNKAERVDQLPAELGRTLCVGLGRAEQREQHGDERDTVSRAGFQGAYSLRHKFESYAGLRRLMSNRAGARSLVGLRQNC